MGNCMTRIMCYRRRRPKGKKSTPSESAPATAPIGSTLERRAPATTSLQERASATAKRTPETPRAPARPLPVSPIYLPGDSETDSNRKISNTYLRRTFARPTAGRLTYADLTVDDIVSDESYSGRPMKFRFTAVP